MKKLIKILLWIVGVVVALVLTLPLWIGVVVKPIANAVVSSKTGTGFCLGDFGLNQYVGRLAVGDLWLANPEGCKEKMAVTLGKMHVDVDMGTVLSDTIVVEDVVLKDVFVSYVTNDKGEANFTVIQRNATGGAQEQTAAKQTAEKHDAEKKPADASKPAKKVIIDHLLIENVLVQLGPIPIRLPNLELNGIGRKSDGVTMAEAWNQISESVMKSFSAVGVSLSQLGSAGMDQTLKALEAAKAVNVKGLADALKSGTKLVGGVADSTVDGTGKTVDAVNEAAGKTLDAVGESAGKAVDTLKGLFK